MLPLMQAAVQAEIAVDIKAKKGVDTTDSGRKLVRFCSFDFSSVTSPSDMAVGSNAHLSIKERDRAERHDFKSRLWLFFSPFLFPPKEKGRRK